jgi:hypothetical protein
MKTYPRSDKTLSHVESEVTKMAFKAQEMEKWLDRTMAVAINTREKGLINGSMEDIHSRGYLAALQAAKRHFEGIE